VPASSWPACSPPSFSRAAERATPEEAKALAEKAAAHLAQVGAQKAIADFMEPAAHQDQASLALLDLALAVIGREQAA
jgi:hypothetical protein